MSLADEIDALLQQAGDKNSAMHRLGRGEGVPGATEREMIELLIAMSNAVSTSVRRIAEQVDELRAGLEASPPVSRPGSRSRGVRLRELRPGP